MIISSIMAIDPGPKESAYVVYDPCQRKILASDKMHNVDVLVKIRLADNWLASRLFVEMVASYGMAVGADVFETCVWIGKFMREWDVRNSTKTESDRLFRMDVKRHLCHNTTAKDSNIRQALIDNFGGPDVAIGGKKCQRCKGKAVSWVESSSPQVGRHRGPCPDCDHTGWKHPPGPLHGVSGDVWSALAVAVTAAETMDEV